jgi:hypothetical protein
MLSPNINPPFPKNKARSEYRAWLVCIKISLSRTDENNVGHGEIIYLFCQPFSALPERFRIRTRMSIIACRISDKFHNHNRYDENARA